MTALEWWPNLGLPYAVAGVAVWVAVAGSRAESTMRNQAAALGFSYARKDDTVPAPPHLPLGGKISNVLRGTRMGIPVASYKFSYSVGDNTITLRVVEMASSVELPSVWIQRRRDKRLQGSPALNKKLWPYEPSEVDMGPGAFTSELQVYSAQAGQTQAMVTPGVQEWLVSKAGGRTFITSGRRVLVVRRGAKVADTPGEIDLAIEFAQALEPAAVWAAVPYASTPSPIPQSSAGQPNQWSHVDRGQSSGNLLATLSLVFGALSLAIPPMMFPGTQMLTARAWVVIFPVLAVLCGRAAKRRMAGAWNAKANTRLAAGLALGWTFTVVVVAALLIHAAGCDKPGSQCGGGSDNGGDGGDGGGDYIMRWIRLFTA
jgi:hypothetical protein